MMLVQDFINILSQFDPTVEVIGTWEGDTHELEVYLDANGRVMVDVDDGVYKLKWQKIKCRRLSCQRQATGTPFGSKRPVCYQHWNTFATKEEKKQL